MNPCTLSKFLSFLKSFIVLFKISTRTCFFLILVIVVGPSLQVNDEIKFHYLPSSPSCSGIPSSATSELASLSRDIDGGCGTMTTASPPPTLLIGSMTTSVTMRTLAPGSHEHRSFSSWTSLCKVKLLRRWKHRKESEQKKPHLKTMDTSISKSNQNIFIKFCKTRKCLNLLKTGIVRPCQIFSGNVLTTSPDFWS